MQRTYLDYPVEVEITKSNKKRLIVLLHGFGASIFSWRTVTNELAELGEVVAYDRPGFGKTPTVERNKNTDPYSLSGQVKLLDAIINAHGLGKEIILMGHSAGGLIAAEYTLLNPGKVDKLILESPAIWTNPPIPKWLAKILRNPKFEKSMTKRLLGFEKAGMKILEQSWFNKATLTKEVIDGYRAPMQDSAWTLRLWRFTTASQSNNVRKNLWRLNLPVFVVTGQYDKIVKVEHTFKVAERILGHRIYLVDKAGHLAHEEQPADFLRVVKNFIEKK